MFANRHKNARRNRNKEVGNKFLENVYKFK